MKGTFFSKPLEWNVETQGESWPQGSSILGKLTVRNHGQEKVDLSDSGVALGYAEIKKIHSKTEGALKVDVKETFSVSDINPGETLQLDFSLALPPNCPVSDKKASYYLSYGKGCSENHLQLKIEPKVLYTKIIGLLDTFHRFKLKEYKGSKMGVEYKLLPPTSRDMANIDSLNLTFQMEGDDLYMKYNFNVKKLDTSSITTKVNKATVNLEKILTPKEYSLGKDMINQDQLLKSLEGAISEVKIKSVF